MSERTCLPQDHTQIGRPNVLVIDARRTTERVGDVVGGVWTLKEYVIHGGSESMQYAHIQWIEASRMSRTRTAAVEQKSA